MYLLLNILTLTLIHQCYSANILAVFPVPSISHQVVFRPITQELAKRGHSIVVLTPDPAFKNVKQPDNFTEIDLHDVSYNIWREEIVEKITGDTTYNAIGLVNRMHMVIAQIFEAQWTSEVVQEAVRGKKFDLVIVEAGVRLTLALPHLYNTPVVQVSSLSVCSEIFYHYGAARHPILYPEIIRSRIQDLSLLEKVVGLYEEYQYKQIHWSLADYEDNILRRMFGSDIPSVTELTNNVDLLLLNVHPIWDNNRPVPPSVVYMGGIHQKPVKELPNDLKAYLDNSVNGVIYMSFGTNVNTSVLPMDKIKVFTKVFGKLPYDVLWKWNDDYLVGKPDNVKTLKWLPQSDVLRHPKIRLFITQAGLQSTDEAISAGVPLIAIPMLGDQWYNADMYVKLKIGLRLSFDDLTEKLLEESIATVIQESYRDNVRRLANVMHDQMQSPLERAIWSIEYVLRHGGAKHLRAPSVGVGWIEYLMLDIVAFLVGTLVLIIVIVRSILKFLYASTSKKIKDS